MTDAEEKIGRGSLIFGVCPISYCEQTITMFTGSDPLRFPCLRIECEILSGKIISGTEMKANKCL